MKYVDKEDSIVSSVIVVVVVVVTTIGVTTVAIICIVDVDGLVNTNPFENMKPNKA